MDPILIVEKNSVLEVVFSVNLKASVGVEIVVKKNHADAIEELKANSKYSLIIARNIIDGAQSALEVFTHLSTFSIKIPMIVMGAEPLLESSVTFLPDNPETQEIVVAVCNSLNLAPKDEAKKHLANYYNIDLRSFIYVRPNLSDVFLKLKTSTGDQYIKLSNKGDTITQDDIKKYLGKGITRVFIGRNSHYLLLEHT